MNYAKETLKLEPKLTFDEYAELCEWLRYENGNLELMYEEYLDYCQYINKRK